MGDWRGLKVDVFEAVCLTLHDLLGHERASAFIGVHDEAPHPEMWCWQCKGEEPPQALVDRLEERYRRRQAERMN